MISSVSNYEYPHIFIRFHDFFDTSKWKLMVFEELNILRHLINLLFDFLELRFQTFEVILELLDFLSSFFILNFKRDFSFVLVHIIYQLLFIRLVKYDSKAKYYKCINARYGLNWQSCRSFLLTICSSCSTSNLVSKNSITRFSTPLILL